MDVNYLQVLQHYIQLHAVKLLLHQKGLHGPEDGDVLEMTVDLNEHTLSSKVNDTDLGALSTNIADEEYRLALSLIKSNGSQFQFIM